MPHRFTGPARRGRRRSAPRGRLDVLVAEVTTTGQRTSDLAAALMQRLLPLAETLGDDVPRRVAAGATAWTLDLLADDPSGQVLHAGHEGWTGPAVMSLALLELAARLGRDVDLLARPRVALGDRVVLALVGVDGLTEAEAALVLDTTAEEVARLLRRGLDHVGQPMLARSTCPTWRAVVDALEEDEPDAFVTAHRRRCDPCNTLACLHAARRRDLSALPGLASLAGLGRAWLSSSRSGHHAGLRHAA